MEKTLTFSVEDALLSPYGFSILSGAGLIKKKAADADKKTVHVHATTRALVDNQGKVDLTNALMDGEKVCASAPIFAVVTENDGSLTGEKATNITVDEAGKILTLTPTADLKGKNVFIDYYVLRNEANTYELQIDGDNFAGNYYVEADTLFRRKDDGKDLPAILTFPNVKIQSNFTFAMASTGDPSTFSFTMDALPGYTFFDKTKQVLCVMQIVEDAKNSETEAVTVMGHVDGETFNEVAAG